MRTTLKLAGCVAVLALLVACPTPQPLSEAPGAWSDAGAWPEASYAALDQTAAAVTATGISDLAYKLGALGQTETAKARAIYTWVTKNIAYDAQAYFDGTWVTSDQSAAAVLQGRKAVCAGYAALYEALCTDVGLSCTDVLGYAKGYGYTAGASFTQPDHASKPTTRTGIR